MNRVELRDALRAAGFPDDGYTVEDLHEASPRGRDGTPYLEFRDGQWIVGFWERGKKNDFGRFASESDACDYMFDRLTEPAPVRHVLSDDEMARGREKTEKLRREMDAVMDEFRKDDS